MLPAGTMPKALALSAELPRVICWVNTTWPRLEQGFGQVVEELRYSTEERTSTAVPLDVVVDSFGAILKRIDLFTRPFALVEKSTPRANICPASLLIWFACIARTRFKPTVLTPNTRGTSTRESTNPASTS